MSGIGKFKLSDALPKAHADALDDANATPGSPLGAKGQGKAKPKSKKATKGKAAGTHEQAAEQVREARESAGPRTTRPRSAATWSISAAATSRPAGSRKASDTQGRARLRAGP